MRVCHLPGAARVPGVSSSWLWEGREVFREVVVETRAFPVHSL